MGSNKISTNSNPKGDKDLVRKKYVDDQDARTRISCLSRTGGTMKGNIVMGNNRITTTLDPIDDTQSTRKKYIDDELKKKLSLTGGTMLGNHKIISNYHQPTHETHIITRKYVDVKFNTAVYEMKNNVSYMIYDSGNKKIRAVYNQTETENLDVNLEATHGQNNRPFYENTNTMYFRDENNFFEVPVNINTQAVPSNLGFQVGPSSLNTAASSKLKDRVYIFVVYEMERQNKQTNDFTAIFGNKGNGGGIYRMVGFKNLDNASTKKINCLWSRKRLFRNKSKFVSNESRPYRI